jgi:hypothetical protein
LRTLGLSNATLPPSAPPATKPPPFPLATDIDGGCDAPAKMYDAWSSQIATLGIDGAVDYLIAADLPGNAMAGSFELNNIIKKEKLTNLLYMVHAAVVHVRCRMMLLTAPFLCAAAGAAAAAVFGAGGPREYVHHGAPLSAPSRGG